MMEIVCKVAAFLCATTILGQVGLCETEAISIAECLLRVLGCIVVLMACYVLECRLRMKKQR